MIEAFFKTLLELFKPLFWKVTIMNLIIVAALSVFLIWQSGQMAVYFTKDVDWINSWISPVYIEYIGKFGGTIITMMLSPIIFPIFSYLFQDYIAESLTKQYVGKRDVKKIGFAKSLFMGLKFALFSISLNLIFLPLYLVPGLNFFVFYILNGFLLGGEYYMLNSFSLFSEQEMKNFKANNRLNIFAIGLAITFLFTVPVVNFFAPVIAVMFSWFCIKQIIDDGGYL